MKITVLGDGAFGTAIANLLADNGYSVLLWCYNQDVKEEINSKHTNSKFIPGFKLNKNIVAADDLDYCLESSDFIFEAIPVKFLRSVLTQIKNSKQYQNKKFIILSKGIEFETQKFPSQIIEEIFNTKNISVLMGPSFAQGVLSKDYTCVNLASTSLELSKKIQKIVQNDYFKVEIIDDFIGVQVCAAYKNVITLKVGIAEGQKKGDNTIATIITQGLKNMAQWVKKYGGNKDTVYTYAGVGDLVLTSLGEHSKNLKFGRCLGEGLSIEKSKEKLGFEPEGINSLKFFEPESQILDKFNI